MLLNSLTHCNWMGVPTQIRVYDDKLYVWNDGALPEGITLNELKSFHSSRPRNPIIAEACFKGGYIDSWGSGTIKIVDACKAAKLPDPEMDEQFGGFIVKLFNDKYRFSEEQLQKKGCSTRQIKAVQFVKTNGSIVNKEYQEIAEISERTALRDLEDLVAKGIFIKAGEKKATTYRLRIGG